MMLADVVLAEARNGSWRAASWLLERRHKDNWAAKSKVELQAAQVETQSAAIDAVISEANAAADIVMSIPQYVHLR